MDDITISIGAGMLIPVNTVVRVRAERDDVSVYLDGARLSLKTPAAVNAGLALVKLAALAEQAGSGFVDMRINGRSTHLMPRQATQIGGALLRKADCVDDYQLSKRALK
jgi:hypothetical protein